jgi:dihydrofolate reductase
MAGGPLRIVGYAIVSVEGMIADRAGHMPDAIKIEADQRFFEAGLNAVDAVVHGRHSHEGQANSSRRRRLIVTRKVSGVAEDPTNPLARLWNPAGAPFEAACAALGVETGITAIIGGTDVFGLFLGIGYDTFNLSRANRVRLPGGRPVFPEVPAQTPEQVLASHGLAPGERRVLDARADVTLVTWTRETPS